MEQGRWEFRRSEGKSAKSMCTSTLPVKETPARLPLKAGPTPRGKLTVKDLKEAVRHNLIDTVVVGLTDCYGRLVGKRYYQKTLQTVSFHASIWRKAFDSKYQAFVLILCKMTSGTYVSQRFTCHS